MRTENGAVSTVAGSGGRRRHGRSARRILAALAAAMAVAGCDGLADMAGAPQPVAFPPSAAAALHNPAATFTVGVFPTGAASVRVGDTVGFTLYSSAAGYGQVYLLNTSGRVVALAENLPVAAGERAAFPAPGAGFVLRASPPAGVERVLFLVTRAPFAGFAGSAAGPAMLAGSADAFVGRLAAAAAALPGGSWAAAETRVEVAAGI